MISRRTFKRHRGVVYSLRQEADVWCWSVQIGLRGELLKSGEASTKRQATERVREVIDLAVDVKQALRAFNLHDHT